MDVNRIQVTCTCAAGNGHPIPPSAIREGGIGTMAYII